LLNEVLQRVLQPLTIKQNPSTGSRYYNVLGADDNFRCCKLVLAAWLADCPEYNDVHYLERHVRFWCECPKNKLGDYVPPDKQHPRWDHNLYRTLSDANTKAAYTALSSRHVHRSFIMFWQIPCIVCDPLKPDLLHSLQIGMLDHLQEWISHFMMTDERLNIYNATWLSVPA